MQRYHPLADLAPRDIVSRAIVREMRREGSDHVYLDCTGLKSVDLAARFPAIFAHCMEAGIDMRVSPIPVAPAAHYLMGGVRTDTWGRTTVPRLYACGECACTGVHGANRLASNSLMETVVFGKRVVEHLAAGGGGAAPATPDRIPFPAPATAAPSHRELQAMMWECAGIERDGPGLERGLQTIAGWPARLAAVCTREEFERQQMTTVAALMLTAALRRTESRGGHYRSDYPERDDAHWRRRQVFIRA